MKVAVPFTKSTGTLFAPFGPRLLSGRILKGERHRFELLRLPCSRKRLEGSIPVGGSKAARPLRLPVAVLKASFAAGPGEMVNELLAAPENPPPEEGEVRSLLVNVQVVECGTALNRPAGNVSCQISGTVLVERHERVSDADKVSERILDLDDDSRSDHCSRFGIAGLHREGELGRSSPT